MYHLIGFDQWTTKEFITSSTFWAVLADASMNTKPFSLANCSPSSVLTALLWARSDLFPINIMVMFMLACCLASSNQLARWLNVSLLKNQIQFSQINTTMCRWNSRIQDTKKSPAPFYHYPDALVKLAIPYGGLVAFGKCQTYGIVTRKFLHNINNLVFCRIKSTYTSTASHKYGAYQEKGVGNNT